MAQAEQDQLTRQVGRALLTVAGADWQQIRAEYRSAGRHIEVDVLVKGPDGVERTVRPPQEVVDGLGRLRQGMYRPGRGTWLSALYLLDPPSSFSAEFEPDVEPRWRRVPPPIGFADELRFFPRGDEHIPDWLRMRAGLPPAPDAAAEQGAADAGAAGGQGEAPGSGGSGLGANEHSGAGGPAGPGGPNTPGGVPGPAGPGGTGPHGANEPAGAGMPGEPGGFAGPNAPGGPGWQSGPNGPAGPGRPPARPGVPAGPSGPGPAAQPSAGGPGGSGQGGPPMGPPPGMPRQQGAPTPPLGTPATPFGRQEDAPRSEPDDQNHSWGPAR